jgi:ferric-dicitrate binding protein FerR (iron transport regulator)
MKNLFKKYYNSVLGPNEFSEFTDFVVNKKNEPSIFGLMKPFWDKELKDENITPRSNPALFDRIKEAVLIEKHKIAQRKIKIYSWGLRIAAVFVVALFLSNIFFFQKSVSNQFSDQLQTITTPLGAKTNITLPDGSLVWLNSGSSLAYQSKFSKNRSVTLEGEAFFEVVKSGNPFIVLTNYGDVEVKGTSFNVKAFSDDNSFETTLVEGIVALTDKSASNKVTLKPGQHAVKTNSGFEIVEVETKYFTSWKEGKLLFNKEPFPSFIKKLERWYNVKIEYSDTKLDELWYTGTIEMESISEVMEMIGKAAPVTYSFNNKTRVFTIKAKKH